MALFTGAFFVAQVHENLRIIVGKVVEKVEYG